MVTSYAYRTIYICFVCEYVLHQREYFLLSSQNIYACVQSCLT